MNVLSSQFATIVLLLMVKATISFNARTLIPGICSRSTSSSPSAIHAGNTAVSAVELENNKLAQFLTELASVGPVRFVVVGQGAILETVGSWSNLRYADTPKGRLATVSTDSPCFECHLRLGEVKEVKNVSVEKFGKMLRITRFVGADGSTLLSSILHGSATETDPLHANAWYERDDLCF